MLIDNINFCKERLQSIIKIFRIIAILLKHI